MATLPILHFNDVYRVQPFKIHPKSTETIDVTQFAAMLDGVRESWPRRPDGGRDGLVLFSGDVFAPSTESSVTRGSHMVPVMNAIGIDVSVTGNHDFDFGYPHLSKLVQDTNFPWVLSNIVDTTTSRVPEHLLEYVVLERAGVRIGFIGLVEKEWISTVPTWPENFEYRDMAEVGIELSKRLRNPDGEHKCDIVIALTHARVPNDVHLAKALNALSPSAQAKRSIINEHGADIILGGHDHLYYVSRGVTSWENYDTTQPVLGAEDDHGDVLIVKSGTDFRDLSEFTLQLEDTPSGSVRRKVIKEIRGKHLETQPGSKKCERIAKLLETLLSSVSKALKMPVCKTSVELDLRSALIRTQETAAANWFADVLRHAYDDAPSMQGGADGVFICAGTLRGDSVYGPGIITLGDIMEILPFEDPIIALELDGETIWAALEASLETFPAQEGRFPVISGFRVSWDSRRPPGQRVLGVWLTKEPAESAAPSGAATPTPHSASSSVSSFQSAATPTGSVTPLIDGEPIPRVKGGRTYRVISREYMAQGHDGFVMLKGQRYLVDDESGQMMSAIVRKYLLGCRFVNRLARLASQADVSLLHPDTPALVSRERARQERHARAKSRTRPEHKHVSSRSPSAGPSAGGGISARWRQAAGRALRWSRAHYRELIGVAGREHMSGVDCVNGEVIRGAASRVGDDTPEEEPDVDTEEDLPTIHPVVDGRLKDEGRA
ncbi:Metallo-dependent phosphatase [Obba rivulosa]|uniref:Metallo-dependent phosphatase n=1 Tax=Obba rivulosa TaxID=1052685 RepID=A0A8E2J5Z2_9APHY|nr:Metallo-dependent phosphatase [Obba rivulosa]